MKTKAYAKVNLALDIIGKREDGYHNLRSIMVPIDLYDEIELNISNKDEFICNDQNLHYDDHNTIKKMINLVRNKYQIEDYFKINLKKTIPMQAGLGGGSSDAAAVLRILNELYELNLNDDEIKELCNLVGADVIFSYYSKPALVSGIGDELEFIDINDKYYLLLAKPNKGVSTVKAYKYLELNNCPHPDIDYLLQALSSNKDISLDLGNSLQDVAYKLCPEINEVHELLINSGAKNVYLSGSGSCVFVISKNKNEIEEIYKNAKKYKGFISINEFLC